MKKGKRCLSTLSSSRTFILISACSASITHVSFRTLANT